MGTEQYGVRESMSSGQADMSVIEHLPQPAFVLDCQGRVIVWNHSMERLTGVAANEIVGKGDYEHGMVLFGERRPTLGNILLEHAAVRPEHYRFQRREGDQLFAEPCTPLPHGRQAICTAAPLYNNSGRCIGAIETVTDITEQRSMEDSLWISGEQMRALIRSLPDMIFTLNRDGVYTLFSWTDAKKMGIDPAEIVGKTPHAFLPRREADFIVTAVQQIIETGQTVAQERTFRWHGEQRTFHTVLHPLHDPAGRIVAVTGVSRDITTHVQCERTVQETNQAADLYFDLLSNDIYNTTLVAATVVEMLRERLSGEEEELALRVRNTLEQSIDIIKNIELLNTLGRHSIRLEPVDLDGIIRGQIQRHAGIDIRYAGCSCMVWANALLERVLSNLINNSIKYGGMGVQIDVSVIETGEIVTLTVADNGTGIPDHLKPNIFDRFTRGSRSATGSRGLGLHIVKTLVTGYGGRVWATDRVPGRPECGAAIKVILQKC